MLHRKAHVFQRRQCYILEYELTLLTAHNSNRPQANMPTPPNFFSMLFFLVSKAAALCDVSPCVYFFLWNIMPGLRLGFFKGLYCFSFEFSAKSLLVSAVNRKIEKKEIVKKSFIQQAKKRRKFIKKKQADAQESWKKNTAHYQKGFAKKYVSSKHLNMQTQIF